MRQRFRRWMIVVTVAMTLGAATPQVAFGAEEPLQPDSVPCDCSGSRPPPKKCQVSSNQSGLIQPGGQCGW
jgi:hypothetical protein